MKGILLGFSLLLLIGCQQPTVYVFTDNLTQPQQQALAQALQQQSLPVEYPQVSVPKEFDNATILVSEDKILKTEVEQLASIMQGLGYQPAINYTSTANHFYSNGNIGFYLRSLDERAAFTMPERLATIQCDNSKFNGLVVTFTKRTATFTLSSGAQVTLPWEYLYGYLVIYYKDYSQTYTHSQPLVETPFGSKPSDTYTLSARVNKPGWLNCSLQVVYMD